MENHIYDLIKELSEKADGVWMYDQYLEDSKECAACQQLWKKLKEQDEETIEELKQLVASHTQDWAEKGSYSSAS